MFRIAWIAAVLLLPAFEAAAAFEIAPKDVLAQVRTGARGDVRVLVAGVKAPGRDAAEALRKRLQGAPGIAMVMGAQALGDLDALDDFAIFKRARRMPVDLVIVVRVYPQGDGEPASAVAPVYNKKGKTVTTLVFEEDGSVGKPTPPTDRPRDKRPSPETDGLAPAPAPEETPPSVDGGAQVSTPEASDRRYSVMVLDPMESKVGQDLRVAIGGRLATDLGEISMFDVVTAGDIRAMLEVEANKELAGCTEESCMSEIADALGAELIVTWDISHVGDQHVVTVRIFDAKAAKSAGRGQAKTTDEANLTRRASTAMQTAVDGFFESLLDAGTRSQETFDEKKVGIDEVPFLLGKKRTYWRGANRVPLEAEEFYRAIGREEEAAQLENDRFWTFVWLTTGAVTGGVATVLFVGGLITAPLGGFGFIPIVISLPFYAACFTFIGLAAVYEPRPKPIEEDREMADQFNQRLRRGLGLSDDVVLLLPPPIQLAIGRNLE